MNEAEDAAPDGVEWNLVGPAPATVLHAGQCGAKNLRPAEGAELRLDKHCLRCEKLGAKPEPKPERRDFATKLRDKAELPNWLAARQAERTYQRQMRKAVERGEMPWMP